VIHRLPLKITRLSVSWFWDRDQNTQLCLACTTCGANVGAQCTTKTGGGTGAHVARVRALQELMKQRNAATSAESAKGGQPI
jgi:hypothetical protein